VIILFGTKRMRTSLGTVMLLCQRCQRPSAHAVVKLRTWFTLFFIPLFPVGVKYATACPMCGVGTRIDKAQADHLQAVAAEQVAAPVEMTPDGPLTPYPSTATASPVQSTPGGAGVGGPAPVAAGSQAGPPAPGWWQASDQRWYPPELHPDAN